MNETTKPGNGPIPGLEQNIGLEIEIEELEKIIAPGIDHNHNETLVGDEETQLDA